MIIKPEIFYHCKGTGIKDDVLSLYLKSGQPATMLNAFLKFYNLNLSII